MGAFPSVNYCRKRKECSVDVPFVIKQRLKELRLEQKDLAAKAHVTDSYISQLLSGKKLPPAPDRTDIYVRMEKFLDLTGGTLSDLAEHQRIEQLKRHLGDAPAPLFKGVRELILRKCAPEKSKAVRAIFEARPFGELERLITQKLLDVAKRIAKEELESGKWLQLVARLSGRTYEEMRVTILEFLDIDIFHISAENCVSFLDPLIDSWNIDLSTFAVEIVLNKRLAPGKPRKFEFVEREADEVSHEEPGLQEFLANNSFNAHPAPEEIEFLRSLKVRGKRPTALYYHRELQNLRDPLHFRETSVFPLQKYREASGIDRQMQLGARKGALKRWEKAKSIRRNK
jgi:transcriptional regulator with XRE-family HTH domain